MSDETILAIDPGLETGWALHDPGHDPVVTVGMKYWRDKYADDNSDRWLRFSAWLYRAVTASQADVLAFEDVVHRGKNVLLGYGWKVLMLIAAKQARIPVVTIAPRSLKKWATGSGSAEKCDMVARARELFPKVALATDDEADALLIMAYALSVREEASDA